MVKGWVNIHTSIPIHFAWFFSTSSLMKKRRMKCGGRKKMMNQSHSWKFLVILKTLVNWYRYVQLGSELNSARRLMQEGQLSKWRKILIEGLTASQPPEIVEKIAAFFWAQTTSLMSILFVILLSPLFSYHCNTNHKGRPQAQPCCLPQGEE